MGESLPGQLSFYMGQGITVRGKLAAYAARPGSGPTDETCRSCRHAYYRQPGTRRFWKCALVKLPHAPDTDIRLKTPACGRWESKGHDDEE